MRRALGVVSGLAMGAMALGLLVLGPMTNVEAAGPDAGPAASADAGTTSGPMSPYLIKAGQGTVLPPSVDDAEAFCALVLGCADISMYPPAPDFGGCVNALMNQLTGPDALTQSLAIRECGLRATSCKGLRACALKGADPSICKDVAMEGKDPVGKCDLDARAVQCWRGKVLGVRNCGLANEICVAKSGKAECGLYGACPDAIKDKADWSCAGTRMVKCEGGKFLSIDCSILNLNCVTDSKGVGACASTAGKPCTSKDITCGPGDVATGCVAGKQVNVACADQGMKCADPKKPAGDSTVGVCEMPVDKPCDAKFKAACKGSGIEYCSHGSTRVFQCKTIGANKCVMDKGTGPRCTG